MSHSAPARLAEARHARDLECAPPVSPMPTPPIATVMPRAILASRRSTRASPHGDRCARPAGRCLANPRPAFEPAPRVAPDARRTLGRRSGPVSYTHLRAHETDSYLVCRLL